MSFLAVVYLAQGRYDEAEALQKRTLEGRMKRLGAIHPNTLASMNSLANVYSAQGRYDEAEALRKRASEGRKK
jgi:tetratricopeptide (TPR) repeat protein